MAGGIGKIIMRLLKGTLKSSFKAEKGIDKLLKSLKDGCPSPNNIQAIITQRNRLNGGLDQIMSMLDSQQKTNNTLDKIIKKIKKLIPVIKNIPAPAQFMTAGLIITMGDVLDSIKSALEKNEGIVEQGLLSLGVISKTINNLQTKLNELDTLITGCIAQYTSDGSLGEDDLKELLAQVNTQTTTGVEDNTKGELLFNSLSPNAKDPLFYREFKLEIQPNPNNKTSFKSRRVVGIQAETNILTVSTDYSFASTTEVLVNEAKFLIDKWWITQSPVESNIDLSTIKILEDDPIELEVDILDLPSPFMEVPLPPPLPQTVVPPPPTPPKLYYTARQAQDLGEIATLVTKKVSNVTGKTITIADLKGLNSSHLKVGDFYKNQRKMNKEKPQKGSKIRYQ